MTDRFDIKATGMLTVESLRLARQRIWEQAEQPMPERVLILPREVIEAEPQLCEAVRLAYGFDRLVAREDCA